MAGQFVVANRDLEAFVKDWFANLEKGGDQMRNILDADVAMAPFFLMANIASRAAEPDASDEELLLFAVLAIAQHQMLKTGKRPALSDWPERWDYILSAFSHVTNLGDQQTALVLAKSGVEGLQHHRESEIEKAFWSERSAAERADHERLMASLQQREMRAAKLLDPDIDIDAVIMSMPLNEED